MKIVETIKQHRENKKIRHLKQLLMSEYCLPYTAPLTATEKLYANSQPYAKIMYYCINYYEGKQNDIVNTILDIIKNYGTHSYRRKSIIELEQEVIQLNLPDAIKVQLDNLDEKLESDKQKDLNKLVKKLDEGIKEL